MKLVVIYSAASMFLALGASAQMIADPSKPLTNKDKETEVYPPQAAQPKVVKATNSFNSPPSDALILFDGKNLDEWVSSRGKTPAKWTVADGVFTVDKTGGDIETKRNFSNYQLHIEYRIPENITGEGQSRGNSGIFLAATKGKAGGYELQVLDNYNDDNKTYVNGMVGSMYKEVVPLANPSRKAGEWNAFDVLWTAPTFNADGSVKTKAYVTAFLNGVSILNHFELQGETNNVGKHEYIQHGPSPIKLQAHRDKSEPISFRNIWLREQ